METHNDSKTGLLEARYSIVSTLSKCEKVIVKLKEGTPQHTLTKRRIAAFQIAVALIDEALAKQGEG